MPRIYLYPIVILPLLATILGGCGYTMDSPFPDDVQTVNVPIFTRGKDVFRRDIEFSLTEAVIKRLQLDTPYRLADRQTADTELKGEIKEIEQQVLDYDPDTGVPREIAATFTISFVWRDLRTGEDRVKRDNVKFMVTYIPHEPFDETFFQGQEEAVNLVAKRIVEQLETDTFGR